MMEKTRKRDLIVLFLVVATELIGFGLIIPVLPQIALGFESRGWMLGLLLAAYSIAQFFAAPILGTLSDKYGRKPILVISKIGSTIAYVILALSHNYWWILVSRLLDGFTGGNISVARAYVSDVTTQENRAKGMALIGVSFAVGFLLGPAIGGVAYGVSDTHSLAAWIAGSLSLLAAILTILLLREPKKKTPSKHLRTMLKETTQQLSLRPVWACLITLFIFMSLFSGYETTFSVFTDRFFGYTPQQNSLFFFYAGIVAFFIHGTIARRPLKRLRLAVVIGLIAAAAGYVVVGQATVSTGLYMGIFLIVIGIAVLQAHLPALLTLNIPDDEYGGIMGIYEAVASVSRIIGPLVAYMLLFSLLREAYALFAILLVLWAVSFRFLFKGKSRA